MPVREIDLISVAPGIPINCNSIGFVINCSTSIGESPGEVVTADTCTLVTSGTASTESLDALKSPIKETMSVKAITIYFFFIENSISFSITISNPGHHSMF